MTFRIVNLKYISQFWMVKTEYILTISNWTIKKYIICDLEIIFYTSRLLALNVICFICNEFVLKNYNFWSKI